MPLRGFFSFSLAVTLVAVALVQLPGHARQGPAAIDSATFSALRLRNIGPANMSGRIVDLAVVESNPFTFYVASATGGLWKTTDNGVTFTPLFTNEAVHSIGAIALHQAAPDILWLGTGERANRQSSSWGDGVYNSTDAGRTWVNMGLRDSHHIGRIVIHPANPDIVYVAAMGHLWGPNKERGLFKTTDGGKSWANILFVNEDTGVVDVAMDPSDPNILYAASYQRRRRAFGFHGGGPGSGLHASTDGGATWHRLRVGLPDGDIGRIGISIHRKNPRIVYVSVEQGLRYNASTAYEERKAGIYRSEDRGDTWRHMSDWNPRPMYASQILVDPSDDQRIYMVNSYSFSDDGGRTFTTPRQSLHGDDRVVWVNPANSHHVMKGDDGGLGISYDRGLKWLYVTSLPISQFYRIDADMGKPFRVCGGLQDNGSWCGPSATYYSSGIRNSDWMRVGGGDGFFNRIDPRDPAIVYSASQFLGLTRVNVATREVRDIRPGDPTGHIQGRRNWKTWGQPGAPEPLLGNAMEPANWDAPFILSPHDPDTIYAGARRLWRSTDRGNSWTSLSDPTTQVDRSTLAIMGQKPGATTLSLDDGVPYYPTITAIAESPRRKGLLYVGTDDGNLQVSRDGGATWTNAAPKIPGLPPSSWVSGVEASRHDEGTVYAAFDNHASDDYRNYLFKSSDFGASWTSIAGDLPANRVVKAVHEDPKNPRVIYIGTEFGFFFSLDGGGRWLRLVNNLPTVPVNDFLIHPRDNDLVLATHGRGIWILENIAPLQELTPAVLASEAHVFGIEPAEIVRYTDPTAHAGDMVFRGENPPAGMVIDYYLSKPGDWTIWIAAASPDGVQHQYEFPAARRAGLHRFVWNFRSRLTPAQTDRRQRSEIVGPPAMPGDYTVQLVPGSPLASIRLARSGNGSNVQRAQVMDDARLSVTPVDRRTWFDALKLVADTHEAARELVARTQALLPAEGRTPPVRLAGAPLAEARDAESAARELVSRLATLYGEVDGFVGPPTADQRSQMTYYLEVLKQLQGRVERLERGGK
jgi:photosystem II stability/assembly factor-like uncharacterized protein